LGRPTREKSRFSAKLGGRRGIMTLFAALDIATGEVIGQCFARHRSREFLNSLRTLEARIPTTSKSIW